MAEQETDREEDGTPRDAVADPSAVNDNGADETPVAGPAKPKVFSIDADQHFVRALAQGILDEAGDDPLRLADYTILLPTREACFALREAFAELSGGQPAILPRIDTPGDIDGDDASLKVANDRLLSQALIDLPPAISPMHRQLLLAREILKIPSMASSPQKAVQLGGELGQFLDTVQRHRLDISEIKDLVGEAEHAEHWGKTADFLKILTERWPEILEELGMMDPEEHQNAMINIQAMYWERNPPGTPIIMAGFRYASPAVANLLDVVSRQPESAVVLPGLETEIDDASWDMLSEVHPQYGMKSLVDALGIDPKSVEEWPVRLDESGKFARSHNLDVTNEARRKLLRESMRPAKTSEEWSKLKKPTKSTGRSPRSRKPKPGDIDPRALNGMDLITCGTPQEEASVIALKMREALEVPGRNVALVTPDRSLARRVSARLRYWGINVEDSAGTPLDDTPAGAWIGLTAKMAEEKLSPVALLECLKHPLAAGGQDKWNFRDKVIKLEEHILHGSRPPPGFDGLKNALGAEFNRVAMRYGKDTDFVKDREAEVGELNAWLAELEQTVGPFVDAMNGEPKPFAELLDMHIRLIETLANTEDEKGEKRVWRGDDGKSAAFFLTDLREYADVMPALSGRDYVNLLHGLMHNVTVKSRTAGHPNLKILSPREARLVKPDTMIVGGLNEDKWPGVQKANPWMSREMMKEFGLPIPEVLTGKSAHDYVQAVSTPNVLMTRSERSGDAPSVPSPLLTRLLMVLEGCDLVDKLESKAQLAAINAALNTPAQVKPIDPPAPKPPADARPQQLPVTAIETLIRDPYSLYAKYVLKVRPKQPIDADPTYSERGMFIHEALEKFVSKFPDEVPEDAYEQLLEIGRETFRNRMENPSVRAFWWPRFERIAKWFVEEEGARREFARTLGTEVQGRLEIDTGKGKFVLTAIADRIDRKDDDSLSIIDYKTGGVPTQKSVGRGFSPQLTLEALIAQAGGFKGIDASPVSELEYWKLSGGRPPAKITQVKDDINKLSTEAQEGLTELIRKFSDARTPYLSTPRPRLAPRYNNYAHLSREDEWRKAADLEKKKQQKAAKAKAKKKAAAKKKTTTARKTTTKTTAKKKTATRKKAPAKKKTTTRKQTPRRKK